MSEHHPPPEGLPDEADDLNYPASVEGTGSARDDEPVIDEPIEH